MEYANVVVNITSEQLDREFIYRIPEAFRDMVSPGTVVTVPFGKGGRTIPGYVTSLTDETPIARERIRDICSLSTDADPAMARLVALAAWIRGEYGCTMIQALRTVIPVRRKVKARQKQMVCLQLSRAQAYDALETFSRKHQSARARLLEALIEEPQLPMPLLRDKLGITSSVITALEEKEMITVQTEVTRRTPSLPAAKEKERTISLNAGQRRAVRSVLDHWDDPVTQNQGIYLLYGVTGSGKTEVYLELIEHAIACGKQAIMLIPEIALTYQTMLRFYRRFGDRVSFIHSRLSQGERYDQFERAKAGEIDVMIGPRSALFTPFPNLGIIVIDEEHEGAYLSETTPRYHSVEVAVHRGISEQAKVVLGSATPSVISFYRARQGMYELLTLPERAGGAALPQTTIVDLREEMRAGNRSILSRELRGAMEETLSRGEQMMLFLNRRGLAGFVSCRSCGYVIKCPHCDVSLSLHKNGRMICHYCGFEQRAVSTCPSCGSPFLRPLKAGTQQIEEEVKGLFPSARVLRMDQDTTRGKDAHAQILSAFAGHEADILIGTQMIVKGHDFPDVTLMGILAADLSLYVPDFRSAERTFQLLTQAAGRAGRAARAGRVIVQAYDTAHYSLTAAAAQDYEAFYEQEIAYRGSAGYPPAGSLVAVHMTGTDEARLKTAAQYLAAFAARAAKPASIPVEVLGPAEEPIAKLQDQYRMALWLKAGRRSVLTALREKLEQYVAINEGFSGIGITYETA